MREKSRAADKPAARLDDRGGFWWSLKTFRRVRKRRVYAERHTYAKRWLREDCRIVHHRRDTAGVRGAAMMRRLERPVRILVLIRRRLDWINAIDGVVSYRCLGQVSRGMSGRGFFEHDESEQRDAEHRDPAPPVHVTRSLHPLHP